MSKILPAPGNYRAKLNGKMVIGDPEENNDFLKVKIPYTLVNSEVAYSGIHDALLVSADGVKYDRTVTDLSKVFGWDGINFFDLEDVDGDFEFELNNCRHNTGKKNDEDGNPVYFFNSGFLNPIGGGSGAMPKKIDDVRRKQLLTKYGSKFKAGSKPVATAKPAAKSEPAKPVEDEPPARPAAGKKRTTVADQARTSTQNEVWLALKKARKEVDIAEDVYTQEFYDAQDAVKENANGTFTPAEWGVIATALEV